MEQPIATEPKKNYWDTIRKTLYVIGTLVLFLFALDLMISSLQHLGTVAVEAIILATSNPFTGLFIGLLITAMIQSSSTTTSLAVAMVASGSITLENAIPIIMGANVGTTITSTIVSLGFINKKREFRRAVAAGTYHDFFNILTVIILFPLEYYYGFLSHLSEWVAHQFFNPTTTTTINEIGHFWSGFNPVIDFLVDVIPNGFVLTVFSFGLLFTSIILFRRLLSNILLVKSPDRFSQFFFKNKFKSFGWGLITTAAIRSSTITTSLVVPIVAQKITTLRKAAPFILGANIGTTITAFIAATLNSNTSSGISLALAHFLFNFIGFLIFFPIPVIREIPIKLARSLGKLTLRYRLVVFVYILSMFFFIPFSLIYLNRGATQVFDARYERTDAETGITSRYRVISRMNTVTQSGEWLMFGDFKNDPERIITVYKKNNILFIDKDMYMFNKPGFCWDGQNSKGKYQSCIGEIIPRLELQNMIFDSVYVYQNRFYDNLLTDSTSYRYYISVNYPLILKKEKLDKHSRVIATEELIQLKAK
ncbi:MAG TPA: Na/Pi symporter [Cyclobacteriaceae bacterium]|nr:Na/Pi symporter [Cyclobacteriaceae bacterium]